MNRSPYLGNAGSFLLHFPLKLLMHLITTVLALVCSHRNNIEGFSSIFIP